MKYLTLLGLLILSMQSFSQKNATVEQFDSLINKSGNYQEFKVIKKVEIAKFKKELLNTINSYENNINELNVELKAKNNEISELVSKNNKLNKDIENAQSAIDNIDVFGLIASKKTYNIVVWSIVGLLLAIIAIIIIKFKTTYSNNNELRENLENLNREFDEYKIVSLEKQQKLGRELLDVKKKLNNNTSK